jgi:hypothetical protein
MYMTLCGCTDLTIRIEVDSDEHLIEPFFKPVEFTIEKQVAGTPPNPFKIAEAEVN